MNARLKTVVFAVILVLTALGLYGLYSSGFWKEDRTQPAQQAELKRESTQQVGTQTDARQERRETETGGLFSQLVWFGTGFLAGALTTGFFLFRYRTKSGHKLEGARRQIKKAENRTRELEEQVRIARLRASEPSSSNPREVNRNESASPSRQTGHEGEHWQRKEEPISREGLAGGEIAQRPAAPVHANSALLCREFNRLLSTRPGRETFERFFEGLSDPDMGGAKRLEANGEFLVIATFEDQRIAFPSFDFVSMLDTTFTTLASVPDSVRSLYDLERGAGEVSIDRLAALDHEGRVLTQGVLCGFAG